MRVGVGSETRSYSPVLGQSGRHPGHAEEEEEEEEDPQRDEDVEKRLRSFF